MHYEGKGWSPCRTILCSALFSSSFCDQISASSSQPFTPLEQGFQTFSMKPKYLGPQSPILFDLLEPKTLQTTDHQPPGMSQTCSRFLGETVHTPEPSRDVGRLGEASGHGLTKRLRRGQSSTLPMQQVLHAKSSQGWAIAWGRFFGIHFGGLWWDLGCGS